MFTDAPFKAFGLSHGVAVACLLVIGFFLLRVVRKDPDSDHKVLRYILAGILLYSPFSDPINALLRHGRDSWEIIYATEFPLYLCDWVAVVLGIALIKKSQRLTEIGYAWGMAGTAQGLITPVLGYNWPALEYFSFFNQHGMGPIAAILLIWGFGLRPEKGAYKRIWLWTWGYVVIVMILNLLLGTNYGFLNGKPEVATAYDYLGPYPWYLISLHGIAAVVYWLLLLPFRKDPIKPKGML